MPEFALLPCADGDSIREGLWGELRTAIINRKALLDALGETGLPATPAAVSAGDAPGGIAAYRAAVAGLAPFFLRPSTIASGSPEAFTASTLRTDAFGSSSWTHTPSCPPHADLWNEIKSCLDLLKWRGGSCGRNNGTEYLGLGGDPTEPSWEVAREDAFNDVGASSFVGSDLQVGRWGEGVFYDEGGVGWGVWVYGRSSVYGSIDINLGGLSPAPSMESGYLLMDYDTFDGDYYKDVPTKIVIGSTTVYSGSIATGGGAGSHSLQWELSGGTINFGAGTTPLYVQFDGSMGAEDGDWGAPTDALVIEYWRQNFYVDNWSLYIEYGWD